MIDYQSGYILRPIYAPFIYLSLLGALILNLIPLGNHAWVPDFLIICIVFWNVHQHRYVGVITAFLFGLLSDVHSSSLLGVNSFSYAMVAYIAIAWHRRIIVLSMIAQVIHVLPIFILVSLFPVLVDWVLTGSIHWWGFSALIQALIESLLWPIVSKVLLAPQRRPLDVDPNRPI